MSTNFLSLKNRVMARIYFEYAKNLAREYPDYFMMGLFVAISLLSVSVVDVFNNTTGIMRSNVFSVFAFALAAIKNTSWIIQLFLAGFVVRLAILSAKIIYRNGSSIKWNLLRLRY